MTGASVRHALPSLSRPIAKRGFTLIEVLIAVVVLTILAAIAYPSYVEQVKKGKRAEAKSDLLAAVQAQERFFTNNSTYTADLAPLFGLAAGATVYSGGNHANNKSPYALSAAACAGGTIGNCFVIAATTNTASGYTDARCGNLTISNTGQKGRSGNAPLADCW
jgi:type IV pilus assembly protein PilE